MPLRLSRPTVGLRPTRPLHEAGDTTEPSVSVPMATAHKLAATAAPEPELEPLGLRVERSLVGNYTTALDMAGASLTVCLLDDEIRRAWDAPVHTAALRWGR